MNNETLVFENEIELACNMFHDLIEYGDTVSCVADYEHIKELATALIIIGQGEVNLENVELYSEEMDGYNKEYTLMLDVDGIWINKAMFEEGRYFPFEDGSIYVHGDCNSKIFKGISEESDVTSFIYDYEVEIEEDEECDGDCENCACCSEEDEVDFTYDDDVMHGFSFTKSEGNSTSNYSFYSSDTELVEKMRKELVKAVR